MGIAVMVHRRKSDGVPSWLFQAQEIGHDVLHFVVTQDEVRHGTMRSAQRRRERDGRHPWRPCDDFEGWRSRVGRSAFTALNSMALGTD
jgi:hypothetical protein